jgi:uncharacterized protein (DUF433 family)
MKPSVITVDPEIMSAAPCFAGISLRPAYG